MEQWIFKEFGHRHLRVRVFESSERIVRGFEVGGKLQIIDGYAELHFQNCSLSLMKSLARHEMVHVNQLIYHPRWFRWGTSTFRPASSIVRFGMEVQAYAKYSDVTPWIAGPFLSVAMHPGAILTDIFYGSILLLFVAKGCRS